MSLSHQQNKRRHRITLPLARVVGATTNGPALTFYVNTPLATIRVGVSVAPELGALTRSSVWTIQPQRHNPMTGGYTGLQIPAGRSSAALPDGYSVQGSPEADRLQVLVNFVTGSDFGAIGGRWFAVITWEAPAEMSVKEFEELWKPQLSAPDVTEVLLGG